MKTAISAITAAVMAAAVFVGINLGGGRSQTSNAATCSAREPKFHGRIWGAYLDQVDKNLPAFSSAVAAPEVIEYYEPFTSPFDAAKACYVVEHHAMPLIQLNPRLSTAGTGKAKVVLKDESPTLQRIASGKYNKMLKAEAVAIRHFGRRVALSFGHEMNGPWYSWSKHPKQFIWAWRQIHKVFAAEHVKNVTWVWTIAGTSPRNYWQYWPGGRDVNWIGIDYYLKRGSTFPEIGALARRIRKFLRTRGVKAQVPIFVTETGVHPVSSAETAAEQKTELASLFHTVGSSGIAGVVWFDYIGLNGDWRIRGQAEDKLVKNYVKAMEEKKQPTSLFK